MENLPARLNCRVGGLPPNSSALETKHLEFFQTSNFVE
jgi:hypothetical protein